MTTLVRGHVYVYLCNWIKPPHDKIVICVCEKRNWFIWFNSRPAFHNIGQLAVTRDDHPSALTKDCFLDLSSIKGMSTTEIAEASKNSRGPISKKLKNQIAAQLKEPLVVLAELHRQVILDCVND